MWRVSCLIKLFATDGADTSRVLFASDRAIILVAHLFCSFAVRRHECAMPNVVVEELREQLGWYCAHLSTSMKFDTDVDQNILNSFFEGAKAGAHWGRHNRKIQYGRQPILDFVITS